MMTRKQFERFFEAGLAVNSRFEEAAMTFDLTKLVKCLIDATRLWNYADHQEDADILWDWLRQTCPWFYPADQGALLTYWTTPSYLALARACFAAHHCGPVSFTRTL